MKSVRFVTGNLGKLKEVRLALGSTVVEQVEVDLEEYQGTPRDVARAKCKRAIELVGAPVLVEDTCLCFDALGGLPGPYIKWFLKNLGPDGLPKLLAAFENKQASAMCIFAFAPDKDSEPILVEGTCRGKVVDVPRGERRFGWDPVFEPEGTGKTFAEMDLEEKGKISHRGKALESLKKVFEQLEAKSA
jgi:inosine triphosphate pyrophosphatase